MTLRHTGWPALALVLALGFAAPSAAQSKADDAPTSLSTVLTIDARGSYVAPLAAPDFLRLAQTESFATSVPPPGWARFDNGIGTAQQWTRLGGGVDGDGYAFNRYENVSGGLAEDYLATPQVSVTASDNTLTFANWQSFGSNFGSTYDVLVSTGSQTTIADYTVVASWDEVTQCPGPGAESSTSTSVPFNANCEVDLSAYDGQDVYIAFRHTNDDGDNFNLDVVTTPNVVVASDPPGCVASSMPADGATVPYGDVSISWTAPVGGADGYFVDIGTSAADPTDIANGFDAGAGTSVTLTGVGPEEQFFYRIRPYNTAGAATGCDIVGFQTEGATDTFPYTETFDTDASDGCDLPANWGRVADATTGETWIYTGSLTYGGDVDHTSGTGCFAGIDDSSPDSGPLELLSPFFDFSALTSPRLVFWYQNNAGSTDGTTSELSVDVTTDGGATYTTGLVTVTDAVDEWTEYTADLTAFAGQSAVRVRFLGTEVVGDFDSDPSLDDVRVEEAPTTAVFALSPLSQDFGVVPQCGVSSQLFTITNTGAAGTALAVQSVVLSGDAGFTLTDDASGTILDGGDSATFEVAFSPTAAGALASTTTVSYTLDGGAVQTQDVTLSGEGDADNRNVAVGEGYLAANSTVCAGADEASVLMVPFGTAEGDTEVTLGDDEVTASIPLGTRIRLYGQPHNNMFIGSNGFVAFGADPANNFPSTTTGINGTTLLHLVREDLNPSDGGQIFYGFRDVTGNPALELIVTFYRVRYFGSASYVTAQAIVSPSATRGGNSTVVMQYLNGTDPSDGLPYSDVDAANAEATVSSLLGDQALMQTVYTSSVAPAPLFGTGGTLTVAYTPRGEQIVTGDAGWRLLSHGPSSAPDTEYLVEQNLVQGLSNEYPANDVNLFTTYDGTTYGSPANRTEDLTSGKGLFWYFFDRTQNPVTTTGISNSVALPAALLAGGPEATEDVVVPLTAGLDPDGVHSEMLGNPFTEPFSADDLVFDAGDASNVALLYDPVSNDFSPAPGNEVPVWGGFFVDAGSATEVTFPAPGAPSTADEVPETRRIAFELSGARADGSVVMDRGAVLSFSDAATAEWDAYDALKPAVPGARVELGIEGGLRGGLARPRAQASYPLDAAVTAELSVGAVGTAEELTLRWDAIDNVPDGWTLQLRDLVTGAIVDLREHDAYAFTVTPTELSETDKASDAGLTPPVPSAKASAPVRFVVQVTPDGTALAKGGEVTEFALAAARPNPVRGTTAIRFALPETSEVDVTLYDLLGRRVAVLAQGERAAGWHDVSLDASALSAGVYVLRMQTDGFAETQRLTVLR